MLDYLALSALSTVIQTQSFELAAKKLFITQSAVSQRIKSLENALGEALLVRTLPYCPTRVGEILLGHFKRVTLLEETIQSDIGMSSQSPHISIAISRDSLETWFVPVIKQLNDASSIFLEIIADDQELTLNYLRKGFVSACASTSAKTIANCKAQFLGYFDYLLVASPAFKKKYFHNNNDRQNLINAPTVIFDNKDYLHDRYLKKYFDISHGSIQSHLIPSVQGFREIALSGHAYALIPKIDIEHELKTKKLVNLFPDKIWQMPIYWHSWNIENNVYRNLNNLVVETAKNKLRQG